MKIMIVDDSRAMRRIVQRTIRQAGYGRHDFLEAENGVEALELIKSDKPDLVLSDWHMPEMSGMDLLKALRDESISVPFGFVTSEDTDEMREGATDAGAMFLLSKPFTPDDMAKVLEGCIE